MFTVIAFASNVASTSPGYLTPVSDQVIRIEGDSVVVPSDTNQLLAVLGFGNSITGLQLESPSLRRFVLPELETLTVASALDYPLRWRKMFDSPKVLDVSEPLKVKASDSGSADTDTEYAFIWLADGPQNTASGEIVTVKATGTTTLAANTWVTVPLTFDQVLPAGQYQVVGFRPESATGLVARLIFPGQAYRPGALCVNSKNDLGEDVFRNGNLGVYGVFAHDVPPQAEFLASGADTSETVYLDLIKVS